MADQNQNVEAVRDSFPSTKVAEIENLSYQEEAYLTQLSQEGLESLQVEASSDLPAQESPSPEVQDQSELSYLNTQALGMMYWGLSKISLHPRKRFHRFTELFIEKTIDKMEQGPLNKVGDNPISVFDQLLQTTAVMMYTQSYLSNINLSKGILDQADKVLAIRLGLATPLFVEADHTGVNEVPGKKANTQKRSSRVKYVQQEIPLGLGPQDLRPLHFAQIVHVKLILGSLCNDRMRKFAKAEKRQNYQAQVERIVRQSVYLLRSLPRPRSKTRFDKLAPGKRAGLAGNYCQILRSLAQVRYYENMEDYAIIIALIKELTSPTYNANLKARDLAEVVQALCYLMKAEELGQLERSENRNKLSLKRELDIICERCARNFGRFTPLTREIINGQVLKLELYYEPFIFEAFKKHNLPTKKPETKPKLAKSA
uniref:Uncharacterized protein n=1 Tax=Strombidium rassoulzadegani TaxID=1082188 RepID=A0A7S3CM00_9SPIT|mmetsp:Transcript_16729/g.28424  ORF Transcript_16729/g.28424 Transcript_16729/m.28424 type:complete len:428 (+) Transcript_16729:1274-2557(+)